MVFSSITFLFYFLPIFLAAYLILPWRNTVLLLGSLFFYAWGEPFYVLLLLVSLGFNYAGGLCIVARNRQYSKPALITAIAGNILFLIIFKYTSFLSGNLNVLLHFFHMPEMPILHLRLPLGISFYTFQAISYLVDVYRNDTEAEHRPINVALYISMFPQLIAGPIVRFKTISEEIHAREVNPGLFARGVHVFAIGLGQKVLLANTLAVVADGIFDSQVDSIGFCSAWLGAISYTGQIYFDFAGYSNMAIGLGMMMGFHFPRNFNYPYISKSITEFWQRWHMTLSSWFRDYLYIPLGGNRRGTGRTYLHLLLVFLLCGLWHGASWTFVIWGGYHGAFLIIERVGLKPVLERVYTPIRHIYALLVVIIGWVIFRSETIAQTTFMLQRMLTTLPTKKDSIFALEHLTPHTILIMAISIIAALPTFPVLSTRLNLDTKHAKTYMTLKLTGSCLLIVLVAMSLASGTYNPFIYFRF